MDQPRIVFPWVDLAVSRSKQRNKLTGKIKCKWKWNEGKTSDAVVFLASKTSPHRARDVTEPMQNGAAQPQEDGDGEKADSDGYVCCAVD